MGKRTISGETWYVCDNCGAGIEPDRVIIVREGRGALGDIDESHFCSFECYRNYAERGGLLPGIASEPDGSNKSKPLPWERKGTWRFFEEDEEEEEAEEEAWRIF